MKVCCRGWWVAGVIFGARMAVAGTSAGPVLGVVKNVGPAIGDTAPVLECVDLDGHAVSLRALANGKPLVVEFGSLTEPMFRHHMDAVNKLAADYDGKAGFVIVYRREAHPAGAAADLDINQKDDAALEDAKDLAGRTAAAKQCADRLHVGRERLVVDVMSDSTAKRYGDFPNGTFLIDPAGKVAALYPWMDTAKLKGALDEVLNHQPVTPEFLAAMHGGKGPVIEMEGESPRTRRPEAVVQALDDLQLSDAQKRVVYPALADFVMELRGERKARQAAKEGKEAAGPESEMERFARLRESATTLKAALKNNLSADQYKKLMDAIEKGPGRFLFRE